MGTVYDGKPSGRGRLVSDDMTYVGEFLDGKKHGHGIETGISGYSYTGEWARDKYNGKGRLVKADTSVHEGTYSMGTLNGYCTIKTRTSSFQGHVYYGSYHGRGLLSTSTGVYNGEFFHGVQHGEGVFTESNGAVFTGQWRRGLRHGKGVYTSDDGTYTGHWVRNLRSGYGRWVSAKYGVYVGGWKQNMRHNKGTQTYPNGSQYTGGWSRGKKTGFGIQSWSDGSDYKGFWLRDEYNGRGTLSVSGSTFTGEWMHGHREGVFVETRKDGHVMTGPWSNDLEHGVFVDKNGTRSMYIWGTHTTFKTLRAAKRAATRALRLEEYDSASIIASFYDSMLTWSLLFKEDTRGSLLHIVPQNILHEWVIKHFWTLFRKKRYSFINTLIKLCDSDRVQRAAEQAPELFDQLSHDFVANPWIVRNVSYSKPTKKKLLEGLHLGELGRCPPTDPFTRLPLTETSGQFLDELSVSKARSIYKKFTESFEKERTIRDMAYSFDLEDFELSIRNARDAKDIVTLRRLMEERDAFIRQRR